MSLKTFLATLESEGKKFLTPTIVEYCERIGVTNEMLQLHYVRFREARAEKRAKDWQSAFLNSLKGNYYRIWFTAPDGKVELSSNGRQVKAAYEARKA